MPTIRHRILAALPAWLRPAVRGAWNVVRDNYELMSGLRHPLTPPARMVVFVGGGSFHEGGQEYFRLFTQLADLRPEDRVLDVGCGAGRVAIALKDHLKSPGAYEGFDISPEVIRWCQRQITPRYPLFRFQVADVYNSTYNPRGRAKASEYRFPFPDDSFTFVCLTSVFTHLLPDEVEQYVAEIRRVLSPGGRCCATYFLLNPESRDLLGAGKSEIAFDHERDGYRINNPEFPEAAVALPEEWVRDLYARVGLEVCEPIRFGSWCGRAEYTSFQDLVISRRPD